MSKPKPRPEFKEMLDNLKKCTPEELEKVIKKANDLLTEAKKKEIEATEVQIKELQKRLAELKK